VSFSWTKEASALEDAKVAVAIRVDFIFSVEIMAMASLELTGA
jgi:predicted DNA repair protein MutK